jgi:uncharacterized membrane protein
LSSIDPLHQLVVRLRGHWPRWRGLVIIGLLVVVFSGVVSEILIARYNAFQTFAWDLGIFNQAFFTTVSGHGFFYYTADLPSGNGGQLFVSHFSPLLILLLPFYALAAAPPTLLILETVAVGLTAVPLYVFAREELGSERWALFLASVCLASPVLLGIVWYDFHAEAFLPLTIVSSVVCYRLRSWKWFLAAWFLSLAVIETAGPLLLTFGVLAVAGDYFVGHRPYREAAKRVPTAIWVAFIGAVVWLALSGFVVPDLLGISTSSGAYSGAYAVNFRILGASNVPAVIPTALLHPAAAGSALSYDAIRKAAYVALLFGSLGFLPLTGRLRYILPGIIWPILALLSNAGGYYSFGDQYAAYTFPFVMLAAINGFGRIRAWSNRVSAVGDGSGPEDQLPAVPTAARRSFPDRSRLPPAGRAVFSVSIVVLLAGLGVSLGFVSPLTANPVDSLGIPHGIPTISPHDQLLHTLIGMIPPQSSVLTTPALFPELSSRPNAFVLPVSSYFTSGRTFVGALDGYVNESHFLLYDTATDPYNAWIMQEFVNFSGFGVLAEADGAVLYERGWALPPQLWTPESLNLSGGSLAVPPARAAGPNGSYSNVLSYAGGSPNGTLLWSGPYTPLVPGTFRITLTYRIGGNESGPALTIAVGYRPILISIVPFDVTPAGYDYSITVTSSPDSYALAQANVSTTSGSQPTTSNFTVSWPTPALLDLTGWVLSPAASANLYAITVDQISPA